MDQNIHENVNPGNGEDIILSLACGKVKVIEGAEEIVDEGRGGGVSGGMKSGGWLWDFQGWKEGVRRGWRHEEWRGTLWKKCLEVLPELNDHLS